MNVTEFESKKKELGVEGTGFSTTTTVEREWKDKQSGTVVFSISAGSQVTVWFMPKTLPERICIQIGNEIKMSRTATACNWLKGFRRPPTMKTLEKYSWAGIAKTPTGHKTEPDGYGPDGSPSWLLVNGVI